MKHSKCLLVLIFALALTGCSSGGSYKVARGYVIAGIFKTVPSDVLDSNLTASEEPQIIDLPTHPLVPIDEDYVERDDSWNEYLWGRRNQNVLVDDDGTRDVMVAYLDGAGYTDYVNVYYDNFAYDSVGEFDTYIVEFKDGTYIVLKHRDGVVEFFEPGTHG